MGDDSLALRWHDTVIRSDRSFKDLNGHWAQKDIVAMANKLIAEGRTPERFAPDDNITRAEFAALLVRSLGLEEAIGSVPFRDVTADAWYAGAVSSNYHRENRSDGDWPSERDCRI